MISAKGMIYASGKVVGLSSAGITSGLKAVGFGVSMMTVIGVTATIITLPTLIGYGVVTYANKRKLIKDIKELYKIALHQE